MILLDANILMYAAVLQEIQHRYSALARALMDDVPHLMARDALHATVVITTGATAFCSYDRDFDRIPGLRRVEPADVR